MRPIFKVICQAEEKYKELSDDKESRIILKKLEFFKGNIQMNLTYGEIIKKSILQKNHVLIESFFQKYGYNELLPLDNCFCCDLTRTEWRMLYTIRGDELEIVCFILDFVDHPTYNKIFGYKKR